MAAATVTAGMVFQVLCGGDAAQLKGFGNVFLDGMLDFVQFLARIQKTARHGVLQQAVAMLLKIGNLRALQRLTAMLLFMQRLALVRHRFILPARAGVGQKGVNAFANGNHFGLGNDGLAQFFRLPGYRIFFNLSRHRETVYHNRFSKSGQIRREKALGSKRGHRAKGQLPGVQFN